MAERISVLLSEEEILKRISEMAEEINKDYEGEEIMFIPILKGGIFFAVELAKRITVPLRLDFMATSSYGSGTTSTGDIKIKKDLDIGVDGKNVIIVEDIIDSGNTLVFLKQLFSSRNAKSVKFCALLDKPDRRQKPIVGDYVGFTIPDEFVVGYGLDYDQKYRNLPYVGVLHFEED